MTLDGTKSDSGTITIRPPTPSDGELELIRQIAANTYVIASLIVRLRIPAWLLPPKTR